MRFLQNVPRRYLTVGLALALILAIGGAGLGLSLTAQRETKALIAAINAHKTQVSNELADMRAEIAATPRLAKEYLVRASPDGIAIYTENGTLLYALLDVDLRTLPAVDRAMLEAGILVTGELALTSLCEDYTS